MSLIKCGRLLLGKSQTLDPIADRVAAVVCVFLNGVLVCVCHVESDQSRQRPGSKYSSGSSQRLKQWNDAEQEG